MAWQIAVKIGYPLAAVAALAWVVNFILISI